MAERFVLRVNGREEAVVVDGDTPLLYVLRNDLGLNGPKFGCGLAQCGACAVLRDGVEISSCVTPVSAVGNSAITTDEGLGTPDNPHPLQAAFVAEQAAQCGYCISGMVIAAASLLKRNPKPSADEIKTGMDGHLCRCGTHLRIVRAIERAVERGSADMNALELSRRRLLEGAGVMVVDFSLGRAADAAPAAGEQIARSVDPEQPRFLVGDCPRRQRDGLHRPHRHGHRHRDRARPVRRRGAWTLRSVACAWSWETRVLRPIRASRPPVSTWYAARSRCALPPPRRVPR